jgi:hypothetical protein
MSGQEDFNLFRIDPTHGKYRAVNNLEFDCLE